MLMSNKRANRLSVKTTEVERSVIGVEMLRCEKWTGEIVYALWHDGLIIEYSDYTYFWPHSEAWAFLRGLDYIDLCAKRDGATSDNSSDVAPSSEELP